MVDQNHVDEALRKLGSKGKDGKVNQGSTGLMFEADSWDRVLKKMGGNSQ